MENELGEEATVIGHIRLPIYCIRTNEELGTAILNLLSVLENARAVLSGALGPN